MKTCRLCNKTGNDELFLKKECLCKDCHKQKCKQYYQNNKDKQKALSTSYREQHKDYYTEYLKVYRETHEDQSKTKYDPNEIKVCSKCNFVGKASEFRKGRNICLKCHKAKCKAYWQEHNEDCTKYLRDRYAENPDMYRDYQKQNRKTPAGKLIEARHKSKRRQLGFNPINKWTANSHFHHLHLNNDKAIGIHIPEELHGSIPHNSWTGGGMKEINKASLLWLCEQSVI
jgi:hypothetical protein